jgi:hypothetical protein
MAREDAEIVGQQVERDVAYRPARADRRALPGGLVQFAEQPEQRRPLLRIQVQRLDRFGPS